MWRMKATFLLITAVALVVGCGKKASPTSKGDDSTAKLKEENRKLKTENEKLRVETEAARLKEENAQLKAEKARMEIALTNGSDSGVGNEIQLTDAIRILLDKESVYAYEFEGTRYDCGSKLGYMQASIQYALKDPHIKEEFFEYIKGLKI